MSLGKVLKDLGHDLGVFGGWVEKAIPEAGVIAKIIDPPLSPIVSMVESILAQLQQAGKKVTSNDLQQITQAVTVLQGVQALSLQSLGSSNTIS